MSDIIEEARQIDVKIALQARVAELESALREIDQELTVPAAEYVPAIPAAWAIIARALGEPQSVKTESTQ